MYKQNNYPHQTQWRGKVMRGGRPRPHQYRPMQHKQYPMQHQQHKDEYWCETCDRGFPSLALLDTHKQQHQKCNIDGCQFVAHPKIVTKHIQMQHSTGVFKKIAKLNNPEEIKKWIEERKKKYPTKLNVEKKAAEVKEKIERGEKMGLQKGKRDNSRRYENNRNAKSNQNGNYPKSKRMKKNEINSCPASEPCSKKIPAKKEQKTIPTMDDKRKLKPFTGIKDIIKDDDMDDQILDLPNDQIEDEDDIEKSTTIFNDEPKICGALSSLMTWYGSSDDENDVAEHVEESKLKRENIVHISTVNQAVSLNQTKDDIIPSGNTIKTSQGIDENTDLSEVIVASNQTRLTVSDDDSGPEESNVIRKPEVESISSNVPCTTDKKNKKQADNKRTKPSLLKKNIKSKVPSTLLYKLLQNEIIQERNIVLQCIRYIRKNNYFETKKPNS